MITYNTQSNRAKNPMEKSDTVDFSAFDNFIVTGFAINMKFTI